MLTKVGNRWEYVAYAETNEAGQYRVDGLPAGTYRVEFDGEVLGGYAREYWKNVRLLGNATDVPSASTAPSTASTRSWWWASTTPRPGVRRHGRRRSRVPRWWVRR